MALTIHMSSVRYQPQITRGFPSPWKFPAVRVAVTHQSLAKDGRSAFDYVFTRQALEHRDVLDSTTLNFAELSSSTRLELDRLRYEKEVAVWAKVESSEIHEATGFWGSPIGADDDLAIFAITPTFLVGNFIHRTPGVKPQNCVVFCADGTKSQTCIVCQHKGVNVKICC